MIDINSFSEIIALYQKHGWVLRRVLLSDDPSPGLSEIISSRYNDIPVIRASIDAAWFSRPPADGGIAWEIRHLGNLPYALVENLDETSPDFIASLAKVEARLIDAIARRQTA